MASLERCYTFDGKKSAILLKWKVKPGTWLTHSAVLLTCKYDGEDQIAVFKMKPNIGGTVRHLHFKVGDVIHPGDPIMKFEICVHEVVMKDICAQCGADLRQLDGDNLAKVVAATSVSMVHSVPELRISQGLAQQLGQADESRLLKERKLVLLVDLDQTLIHTTNDNIPSVVEDVYHFKLYGPRSPWYHTRFRPGTRHFLEVISKHYELHICTFGARAYAHMIAQLLDPDGKLFSHRILSRDECFNSTSKTGNLKFLFPCGDSMVCIIDDREDVWNFATNVVHVKPYHFFDNTGDINAPPGLGKTGDTCIFPRDLLKVSPGQMGDDLLVNASHNAGGVIPLEGSLSHESLLTKSKENSSDKSVSVTLDGKCDIIEGKGVVLESNLKVTDREIIEGVPLSANVKIIDETMKENSVLHKTEETISCSSNECNSDRKVIPISVNEISGNNCKLNEGNSISVKGKCVELKRVETSSDPEIDSIKEKDQDTCVRDFTDDDDYLLYLEEILLTIHKAYYHMYDETVNQKMGSIPDLKNVIPYVRKKVLKGVNIAFSGVIPTNMPPEKSRLWTIAKSLGANVSSDLILHGKKENRTTHVIAAKLGTAKLNRAKKTKGINIITPDWLYCCAERWEHADERLFPLIKDVVLKSTFHNPKETIDVQRRGNKGCSENSSADNQTESCLEPDSPVLKHCHEIIESEGDCFSDSASETFSYCPMLAFSNKDISEMDKEVNDACNEDSNDDSVSDDDSSDNKAGTDDEKSKCKTDSESSSLESLTGGECPRGWKKRKRKQFLHSRKRSRKTLSGVYESEEDIISSNNRWLLPHDSNKSNTSHSDSDESAESIGSVDEEMAAAIEREMMDF